MITWILAALIFGAAGYVIYRKVKKMKSGDFSCDGCKGGDNCPSCHVSNKAEDHNKNN